MINLQTANEDEIIKFFNEAIENMHKNGLPNKKIILVTPDGEFSVDTSVDKSLIEHINELKPIRLKGKHEKPFYHKGRW